MTDTKDYYSSATLDYTTDILQTLDREFADARINDPSLKVDPSQWGEPEIKAILLAIRKRKLSHNSQVQYIAVMRGFLRYIGNGVLDSMKARQPMLFPRKETVRKNCLSEEQLSRILESTDELSGWRGECMRFMIWTYAYTGLRLGELAKANRTDLDTHKWVLTVRHPKGERTYGTQRIIPIPEPLRLVMTRFLRAREQILAENGLLDTEPLVFPEQEPDKHICRPTIQAWKAEIERISGVKFTVHTLRRTYGQTLLDRGVQLQTVSLMLGHSSTVTTERYYCRKDADSARLEVIDAFRKSDTTPMVNPPMIEQKDFLSGYN